MNHVPLFMHVKNFVPSILQAYSKIHKVRLCDQQQLAFGTPANAARLGRFLAGRPPETLTREICSV